MGITLSRVGHAYSTYIFNLNQTESDSMRDTGLHQQKSCHRGFAMFVSILPKTTSVPCFSQCFRGVSKPRTPTTVHPEIQNDMSVHYITNPEPGYPAFVIVSLYAAADVLCSDRAMTVLWFLVSNSRSVPVTIFSFLWHGKLLAIATFGAGFSVDIFQSFEHSFRWSVYNSFSLP